MAIVRITASGQFQDGEVICRLPFTLKLGLDNRPSIDQSIQNAP